MNNFLKIAHGVDVSAAILSVWQHPELFNQFTLRTKAEGSPHKEVEDIWLRMNDLEKCRQATEKAELYDHRESINYPAWSILQPVQSLILATATMVRATRIGRCFISKMKPGAQIGRHKDIGDDLSVYYDNEPYYSRFHLVLNGEPGSLFLCGDEQVTMRTGELWSFRGDIEHEVINNSAADRIHLVMDLKC
jgi:hypothetical protein